MLWRTHGPVQLAPELLPVVNVDVVKDVLMHHVGLCGPNVKEGGTLDRDSVCLDHAGLLPLTHTHAHNNVSTKSTEDSETHRHNCTSAHVQEN